MDKELQKFVRKLLGEILDHTHMEIVDVDTEGDVIKVFVLTSTITSNGIERIKEVARRHNLDLKYTDVTVFSFKRGRWSR
jgi:porphobilinogen deaminase